jgi:poly(3-hydroxybutyrate) depolymerase
LKNVVITRIVGAREYSQTQGAGGFADQLTALSMRESEQDNRRRDMRIESCRLAVLRMLLSSPVLAFTPADAAPALETYKIDPAQISVSGVSSGGYMAVQMHVAFSATIMGAGLLAAGPYLCAEGNVLYATTRCLDEELAFLPAAAYFRDLTLNVAAAGRIDATSHLAGDRVWLFTGGADELVLNRVVDRLHEYYRFFTAPANVAYRRDTEREAQHAMITEDYGNACGFEGEPYINDCDFDAAGALLRHIYGALEPAVAAPDDNLKSFDQTPFSGTSSLGDEGYIYVPTACEHGTTACGLHVAFHGCVQNKDEIGDQFARHAGYNSWAEANDLIVLYPQTGPDAVNQCWDWWGYTDVGLDQDYATRNGAQMAAVRAMIERVAGRSRAQYCGTRSNAEHVAAGRAYTRVAWWFWTYYYARGSDEYLGFLGSTATTLRETRPAYFTEASACP